MRVLLNEAEQEALMVCSMEAMKLYVLLLRPCMDVATGVVGVVTPISRGGLASQLSWTPPRGSQRPAYMPTIKQVRGLVDELERVGLLRNYSRKDKDDKRLCFCLVLADRAQVRPAEDRPMKGRYDRPTQARASVDFAADDSPMVGGDDGLISEYRRTTKPHSIESAVATGNSIGANAVEVRAAPSDRAVQVAILLRAAGIEATPAQLRASNVADALLQPDADWLAAVAKARGSKPSQRIGVNYLLPIMADMRAPPKAQSGLQGRVVPFRAKRPDPRKALENWVNEQNGGFDDEERQSGWIEGSCQSVVEAHAG